MERRPTPEAGWILVDFPIDTETLNKLTPTTVEIVLFFFVSNSIIERSYYDVAWMY